MTDREHDFKDGFGYAAPHGATPDDLSVVAAQLVEAACRARDGDDAAARAHIAHAVALLQHTPSPELATAEALLASQARRPIALSGAEFARRIGAAYAPTASSSHQLDQTRLRRVLTYISINIDADITLADLAGIAGYSPFHFARKFTLALGVPPRRYVSRMRLERAMAELVTGRLPLAQIAFNAHFSSQASFTRAFRRATGMTPKEYRRWRL